MNKITCDICMDLIPLVQDHVASDDSCAAVKAHMGECDACNRLFDAVNVEKPMMNEKRVLSKIKKQLYGAALLAIVVGTLFGLGLSESAGVFYNVLIMPAIGAIGYFALGKKSYYMPLTLFVWAYLWHIVKYIGSPLGDMNLQSVLLAPIYWAVLYSGFCCLGLLIAFLLKIAFRKEERT